MEHWQDYVRVTYDLVVETESKMGFTLEHQVEAYVVHMLARNINRVDIGEKPVAITLLEGIKDPEQLTRVADECLLIHSYPIRRSHWPSKTYYKDMGIVAYGLGGNVLMECNFVPASAVLSAVFSRSGPTRR